METGASHCATQIWTVATTTTQNQNHFSTLHLQPELLHHDELTALSLQHDRWIVMFTHGTEYLHSRKYVSIGIF